MLPLQETVGLCFLTTNTSPEEGYLSTPFLPHTNQYRGAVQPGCLLHKAMGLPAYLRYQISLAELLHFVHYICIELNICAN